MPMNSVDTVVKNHMLAAPSLYPTRFSVLSFFLLNPGGGYYWTKSGAVGCIYGMPGKNEAMDMSDIDERIKAARKNVRDNPESVRQKFRLAELDAEKLKRLHLAKNIDIYAQFHDEYQSLPLVSITMLRAISSLDNTLLGAVAQTPKINKVWGAAAYEVVTTCLNSLTDARTGMRLSKQMAKIKSELQVAQHALNRFGPVAETVSPAARALIKNMFDSIKKD